MIFALADFIQWKLGKGRYGDDQSHVMGLGFLGAPPREMVRLLKPGDLFFTQRLDAWFSWFMMYFASSPVDHCGLYYGNGRVAHQTFTTNGVHPLRYVAKGSRILFARAFDPRCLLLTEPRGSAFPFIHRLPPRGQLSWAAFEVVLGFFPERFRWRFLADLIFLAMLVDFASWGLSPFPLALCAAALCLAIALGNQLRWRIRRWRKLPPPKPMSHPDLMLTPLLKEGGMMVTRIGPIVFGPFGTLPLKVVQAIANAPAESDEPVEHEAARAAFRDLLIALGETGEDETS